jgi:hypothetical protein
VPKRAPKTAVFCPHFTGTRTELVKFFHTVYLAESGKLG